jgi:hypothetical protein
MQARFRVQKSAATSVLHGEELEIPYFLHSISQREPSGD